VAVVVVVVVVVLVEELKLKDEINWIKSYILNKSITGVCKHVHIHVVPTLYILTVYHVHVHTTAV
jgi:diadenosine tetraphosphate (Ap4A) HIT family hydrolase